jgi:hypothetical protein
MRTYHIPEAGLSIDGLDFAGGSDFTTDDGHWTKALFEAGVPYDDLDRGEAGNVPEEPVQPGSDAWYDEMTKAGILEWAASQDLGVELTRENRKDEIVAAVKAAAEAKGAAGAGG